MSISKANIRGIPILLALLLTGSLSAQHNALAADGEPIQKDIYIADSTVQLIADVLGDAVIAGGSISVANAVAEDVLVAGGTINITANVGDDIRAAGGSIAITGDVGDDVLAAGGTVVLDSASTVGGRAWLAGGTLTVAGNITHGLKAAGETIILAGTIGGDVELQAGSIEIKPSAVIKGNLNYAAPGKADIDDAATITGEVNYEEIAFEDFDADGPGLIGKLVFYLSLAASAFAVFLLFPLRSVTVVKQLQSSPLKTLGMGLLVLFSTPFIALMLLVSVIGVPIGFVVLALYVAVLIIGLLTGLIWVGDRVFRQIGKEPDESKHVRAWSIGAAALVLLVVSWIPFIGAWVFFIVLLLGIGATAEYFYHLYNSLNAKSTIS